MNYTDIVRKPQGPTSIVVRDKQNVFDISVKKRLNSKQSVTVSEASTLFPCPQVGCIILSKFRISTAPSQLWSP